MNDFVRPQSMEVPEGGLASFLTATVGDWADTEDEVPRSGIGGVKAVADHLAEYGRYEDTYMVHAAQGETVVPMAVFDENPSLLKCGRWALTQSNTWWAVTLTRLTR